jgi:hypothetical protein
MEFALIPGPPNGLILDHFGRTRHATFYCYVGSTNEKRWDPLGADKSEQYQKGASGMSFE